MKFITIALVVQFLIPNTVDLNHLEIMMHLFHAHESETLPDECPCKEEAVWCS